jgi:hypothetical protein
MLVLELEVHLFILHPPPPHCSVDHPPFAHWHNAYTFIHNGLYLKYNTRHCPGAWKISSGKATWFRGFWYVCTKIMLYAILRSI